MYQKSPRLNTSKECSFVVVQILFDDLYDCNNHPNNEVLFPLIVNLILITTTTYYNLLLNQQLMWCLTQRIFNLESWYILSDFKVRCFNYKSDWKQTERKYWPLKYFLIENCFRVLLRSSNSKCRIDITLMLILTYWYTPTNMMALCN